MYTLFELLSQGWDDVRCTCPKERYLKNSNFPGKIIIFYPAMSEKSHFIGHYLLESLYYKYDSNKDVGNKDWEAIDVIEKNEVRIKSVAFISTNEKPECKCDIHQLMRIGCNCGFLNKERNL